MKTPNIENIDVNVKAGILSTIAGSVYSSTMMKVREACSNSMDNHADVCVFYCETHSEKKDKVKLTFIDNGDGISRDRFKEIFRSIGCGLNKKDDTAYSYFGLGLMSIFRLGKKATIFSKTKTGEFNKVVIESDKLFSIDAENEEISTLSKYVKISPATFEERNKLSPLSDKEAFNKDRIQKNKKFTEIIIEGIYSEDYENITSTKFINDVRKMMPVKPDDNDPFFLNLEDPDKAKVLKLYENKKFFPTINYNFGTGSFDKIKPLTKYYPKFQLPLQTKFNLFVCEEKSDFSYYVLYSTKNITPPDMDKETGFWIRNGNFLVKSADFFTYQGSGKGFIQEPLTNWIFSEISHHNMKEFLDVTRNQFVTKSSDFITFRNAVKEKVLPLNVELRTIYTYGIQRVDKVIVPLENIGSGDNDKDAFKRAENKLLGLTNKKSAQEKIQEIHANLDKIIDKTLESAKTIEDKIKQKKGIVELDNSKNSHVYIDPELTATLFEIEYDKEDKRAVVRISPSIFKDKKITFCGETYTVKYVDGQGTNAGLSINRKTNTIRVNVFSAEIKNYSMTFIDVLIVVEYAYQISANHHEMKSHILDLLGGKTDKRVRAFYTNLADNI